MLILMGTALQPIGSHCLYEIQSSLSVSKNYLLSQPWNLWNVEWNGMWNVLQSIDITRKNLMLITLRA